MDELEAIKITFFQECDELLVDLENGLLALQRGEAEGDTVNGVFRAVHSIKGGAGVFGFDELVRFAHLFETVLDGLRNGRIAPSMPTVALLLRAHDELIDHVGASRAGRASTRGATQVALSLTALAEGLELDAALAEEPDFGFTPIPVSLEKTPEPPAAQPDWSIVFRPHSELYRKANEPAVLLRELARLGDITVTLDASALPGLEMLDPESAYLGWRIDLKSSVDEASLREVFEFVDGDCDLVIERGAAPAPAVAAPPSEPLPALHAEPENLIWSEPPILVQDAAAEPVSFDAPSVETAPVPTVPESPVQELTAEPQAPSVAPAAAPTPAQAVMRVDPEKVDRLIDLVGELVISQVMLAQKVQEANLPPSSGVMTGLEDLEQLTREIQDGVMAIRAQQVRAVFQRMPRLLREVAGITGKQARLVTEGDATEVDRSVIERLAEPLTHMIRNAVDHGIESPEERIAAGKDPEGVVTLSARHRGGRIVIEIADDGRGIDRRAVFKSAVSKGLVAADANLTDEAIDELICLPGFSTARSVSDISGRGVGMDVVRRSVQALGGRIGIASVLGQGSTITLSLPLTLAVLDGMLVKVAGQTLVAPLSAIIESIQPRPDDIRRIGVQGVVLAVREAFVPLIDIGVALGFRSQPIDPAKGIVLLVETETGARVALVADDIHGQRQVVIKSLESNYGHVEGISAATIMGDGRVALIIDVDAVIGMRQRARTPPSSPPFSPNLLAAE